MTLVLRTNAALPGGVPFGLTTSQQAIVDAGATILLAGARGLPFSMTKLATDGVSVAAWRDQAQADQYAQIAAGSAPERRVENGREFLRFGWGDFGYRPYGAGCGALGLPGPNRYSATSHTFAALFRLPTTAMTQQQGGTILSSKSGSHLLFETIWAPGNGSPRVRLNGLGNNVVVVANAKDLRDYAWHYVIASTDVASGGIYMEIDGAANFASGGAAPTNLPNDVPAQVPQVCGVGDGVNTQGFVGDLAAVIYVPTFTDAGHNAALLASLRTALANEKAALSG